MEKIIIYGLGGQGVVTLGKVICSSVGVHGGKYAKTMPEYGHERRGGTVFADVILDERPILINSFIYNPDIVMVLDSSVHGNGFDITAGIHKNSILVINDNNPTGSFVEQFKECWFVDASHISLNVLKKDYPNIGMLGAFLKLGILDEVSLKLSMQDFFGKDIEKYIRIMEEAYEETRKR